ncbi:hypothetical protein [Allohahella marinimesophila]|uniref:Uncharacterized protein n=1 Tax=Allohahella marinimesophila TaxID=1054972 RepID=A0ABP7NG68_9GAMM
MDFDPDGKRLPIKIDTTSNGEFVPTPLTPAEQRANHHAMELVGNAARRIGLSRRKFVISSAGSAATLLAFNKAHGAVGGFFDLHPDSAYDLATLKSQPG